MWYMQYKNIMLRKHRNVNTIRLNIRSVHFLSIQLFKTNTKDNNMVTGSNILVVTSVPTTIYDKIVLKNGKAQKLKIVHCL